MYIFRCCLSGDFERAHACHLFNLRFPSNPRKDIDIEQNVQKLQGEGGGGERQGAERYCFSLNWELNPGSSDPESSA